MGRLGNIRFILHSVGTLSLPDSTAIIYNVVM